MYVSHSPVFWLLLLLLLLDFAGLVSVFRSGEEMKMLENGDLGGRYNFQVNSSENQPVRTRRQ